MDLNKSNELKTSNDKKLLYEYLNNHSSNNQTNSIETLINFMQFMNKKKDIKEKELLNNNNINKKEENNNSILSDSLNEENNSINDNNDNDNENKSKNELEKLLFIKKRKLKKINI